MTGVEQRLHEDIAYLRSMTEHGGRPALVDGPILVFVGALFGAASILGWLLGASQQEPVYGRWLWVATFAVFIVGMPILIRRAGRRPGASAPANRAAGMAWAGVGMAIFTMMIALWIVAWRTRSPDALWMMAPAVMALYGVAWFTCAAVSRERWVWLPAVGSLAAAVISALFATSQLSTLVNGLLILAIALVPGIGLVVAERRQV